MARFAEYWEAGFTGIIPVIPPDAPLSAASKIKLEDRGKVPGRLNGLLERIDKLEHKM